ncbi:DMT family transporter [Ensifer soli]|uniref:DMT family transporter n=1 Tax=Ciceribacter sp. sgz301302 TaxID=3342379 RepID=UPI0035B7A7AF
MTAQIATPLAETSSTRNGLIVMFFGILMFSLNDVMGKWLVTTYPVAQVVLIRSAAAILILLPFLMRGGIRQIFSVEQPFVQALRVVFSTAELFCFYLAVAHLSLADVMTYWLAAPIYVAALSPLLLGERVGWRRWSAIAVGFLGVVVALEPTSKALTWPALIAVLGSLAFGLMMVTGRMLRATPDATLAFWQLAGAGLVAAVFAPSTWLPVGGADLGMLCLLGVVAMSAHMLVNRALKLADAATVAPLNYMLLVWAVFFGWLIFGETPRPAVVAGAALIVGSGLFIFFREQQLKRQGRLPS